jgi:hypothetical protein
MTDDTTSTRELLNKLAATQYRRSARADQIFRGLRDEPQGKSADAEALPSRQSGATA